MEKFKAIKPRFFASVIDGLILCIFTYLGTFFVISEIPKPIVVAGLMIEYFCYHFYSIYLQSVYGQTLGKMALKIKVLDVSENAINFRQSIWRESPNILFSIILFGSESYQILTAGIDENFGTAGINQVALGGYLLWLIAETVVTLSNEKRRSIHDYLAGTVVVKINK